MLQEQLQVDRSADAAIHLHEEIKNQCRSAILRKYIEECPECLGKVDKEGYLPLHRLLHNHSSSIDDALIMIEKYPASLRQSKAGSLPLHVECSNQCRSAIISKCIELYPEALAKANRIGDLPLHRLFWRDLSTIGDALTMIEKFPASLQHSDTSGYYPIHVECWSQCRAIIIAKCIEIYPEALNDNVYSIICAKIDKSNFKSYASVLSIIFTARPMSLYPQGTNSSLGKRKDPYYRRKILNLLPGHVFTPTHEADYRDLNWQPRFAMMMLLSQINSSFGLTDRSFES
jgi:hypothetical protein